MSPPRQFIAMGADQRNAIRRALNEDAEKLLQEGDPNDPQLRRLKREIDEVNRLFDEFERRASGESWRRCAAVLCNGCVTHAGAEVLAGEGGWLLTYTRTSPGRGHEKEVCSLMCWFFSKFQASSRNFYHLGRQDCCLEGRSLSPSPLVQGSSV